MSIVYKLAFASSALPSRMIGIRNKCTPNGPDEINNSSNELYLFSVFEKSELSAHVRGSSPFVGQSCSKFTSAFACPGILDVCVGFCAALADKTMWKRTRGADFRVAQHRRFKGGSHDAPAEQRSVWSDLITIITAFWMTQFMLISSHSH